VSVVAVSVGVGVGDVVEENDNEEVNDTVGLIEGEAECVVVGLFVCVIECVKVEEIVGVTV
jgi:hypothetical protein